MLLKCRLLLRQAHILGECDGIDTDGGSAPVLCQSLWDVLCYRVKEAIKLLTLEIGTSLLLKEVMSREKTPPPGQTSELTTTLHELGIFKLSSQTCRVLLDIKVNSWIESSCCGFFRCCGQHEVPAPSYYVFLIIHESWESPFKPFGLPWLTQQWPVYNGQISTV